MSQTVRVRTQAPVGRSHFDEDEYQEEGGPFEPLWSEVEIMQDQIEEVKGCAMVSNMETEVSWARFPAKKCVSSKEAGTKKKVLQENGMVF